jgi:hypothetical protein
MTSKPSGCHERLLAQALRFMLLLKLASMLYYSTRCCSWYAKHTMNLTGSYVNAQLQLL